MNLVNSENRASDKAKKVNEIIDLRKSSRNFLKKTVSAQNINIILEAGIKAPSGKNGQPWKFIVIQKNKELLKKIASLTICESFVKTADCLIIVYLDKAQSYHYIKDVQAVGACIENMLLQATALGLDSCWIGEILNSTNELNRLLNINFNQYELMAVILIGYSDDYSSRPAKKTINECILKSL